MSSHKHDATLVSFLTQLKPEPFLRDGLDNFVRRDRSWKGQYFLPEKTQGAQREGGDSRPSEEDDDEQPTGQNT